MALVDVEATTTTTPTTKPASPTTNKGALPSIGTLLKDTWSVFTGRILVLIGVAIIPVIASIGFTFLFITLGGSTFATAITSVSQDGASMSAFLIPLITSILSAALLALIHLWGTTALYHAVIGAGEKVGVGEAYKRGWRHIGAYIWFSIVATIVLAGAFMLLIIPGIVVGVWMSIALVVLIAEDERGMRAIIKSREYVRGNWYKVFVRYAVLGILFALLYGVIGLASSISDTLGMVMGIVSSALSVFIGAFVITYSYVLYLELRVARGNFTFEPSAGKKILYVLPAILVVVGIVVSVVLFGAVFIQSGLNKVLSPSIWGLQYATTTPSVNDDGLGVPDFDIGDELDGFEADINVLDEVGDPDRNTVVCIQVITPALNPDTGSVVNFPTPCDVPTGWEII